ncbi:MAG TPA: Gfo/Idh/MocA family oxidoreductase [Candidatus Krumholzibacteria bacterium]|nr:Gfo/Idh/MocA family oxidoreductase [Candidatus Krumholzibacteria bacterium]
MSSRKTRIAVAGAGHVAQVAHIPAYRANPEVELVAIADYDRVKARRIKDQFGFKESYDDFNEMLKKAEVDAVDLCTPNYLHAPMAIAALRSGRDVLCEKPMSRNAKEAQQMVDAAEKYDRILMVAMNNRFREDAQMLHKFVSAHELGDIQIIKAGWLRRATDWKDRAWFTERGKAGGGALLDLGTPLVDLSIWISGLKPAAAISCGVFGGKGKDSVEDSGCAMVRFDSGACLMLEVNWNLRDERDAVYMQIYGSKGAGILTPLQLHKSIRGVLVNVTPTLGRQKNYYKESYQAEIDHFIQCVRKQKEPATSGKDALGIMKIMDAMYQSASSGKEVSVDG